MNQPELSIIFPIYNEAKILTAQTRAFIKQINQNINNTKYEILFIENGSVDSSWKIIKNLSKQHKQIKFFRLEKASYGQALKLGIEHSRGKNIFLLNLDFYDINFMVNALNLLKSVDMVIGSKTLAASHDCRSQFRRLTTYFFNVFLRLILNYPGTDTHGIKAFKKTPLLLYSLHRSRTRNELLDTELIIRMTRWGANFIELPVNVKEIRPTRYSLWRRICLTIIDLFLAFWSKYIMPTNFSIKTVTADDFGISSQVNQAIISVAQRKIVDHVSILANMVTRKDIRSLITKVKVKYSIHINLVEGKPISPTSQIPSLVNQKGYFNSSYIFLPRLLLGLININEVGIEITSQINYLRALGIKFSRLDSHQHSHIFPPLWNYINLHTQKWGITQIRSFESARIYLKSKILRYSILMISYFLLILRYGKNKSTTKAIDEIIIHPGTNYD